MIELIVYAILLSATLADIDCTIGRDVGETSCGEQGAQRFFYDSKRGICQPFYYKGCGGNGNRFSSRDECMKSCKGTKEKGSGGPVARCKAGNPAAMDENGQTVGCEKCPDGYSCQGKFCCAVKEKSCSLEYDSGKYVQGRAHIPKYFYSSQLKTCLLFTYYGSLGNANNFNSFQECLDFCK
ncbi:unnamed protein product, partial [Mesorhabditis belari]|uniref:BPTI/Kunitz inhibitor domain-containing protein n=1 Tax=Mesorhabditis belari TaxID=2138241 RepID=A0AAF3FF26_9BILA